MQSVKGSFLAQLVEKFRLEANRRPDYGRRPNKALVNVKDEEMLRTQADPPFDWKKNPHDCLRTVVYKMSRDFGGRGMEVSRMRLLTLSVGLLGRISPVSLVFSVQTLCIKLIELVHIDALPEEYGELAGLPAYKMKECEREKTSTLSLAKPTLRDEEEMVVNIVIDNPDDDWSTYKVLRHWINRALPPDWDGPLFLNIASDKERKARPSTDTWWAGTKMVPDRSKSAMEEYEKARKLGENPPLPMRPSGHLGKNWANQNAKIIYKRCGHEKWQKATSRTGRRTAISNVAESGVPQLVVNKFGRHATDRASFKYQEFTSKTFAKAIKANWYNGDESGKFYV